MDKYQQGRKDQLFKSELHDPYLDSHRPKGDARCPQCGVLYCAGRWAWQGEASVSAVGEVVCPACRRIADRAPAGMVRLSGAFLQGHRDEITHLLHNTEAREKPDHPLERLIEIVEDGDELVATTTGMHLANRIGHALEAAYDGDSDYRYSDSELFLSVDWRRD